MYSIFENVDCGYYLYDEPHLISLIENEPNDFDFNREDDRKCFPDNTIFNNYPYYNIEGKTEATIEKRIEINPPKDLPKKINFLLFIH